MKSKLIINKTYIFFVMVVTILSFFFAEKVDAIDLPTLQSLTIDGVELTPAFSYDNTFYEATLDSDNYIVNIEAIPNNTSISVSGAGENEIIFDEDIKEIILTDTNGNINIYTITFYRPASNYKYLSDITIDGVSVDNFNPTTNLYSLTVPSATIDIEVELGRPGQSVEGLGEIEVPFGVSEKKIIVTSEDNNSTYTYTLRLNREHNTKIKNLSINGFNDILDPVFNSDTTNYMIDIPNSVYDLFFNIELSDSSSTYKIENNTYLKNNNGVIKITVSQNDIEPTIYRINYTKVSNVIGYDYIGRPDSYEIKIDGVYKLEVWGAQGGGRTPNTNQPSRGGAGGYSKGNIFLHRGDILYSYVGGQGVYAGCYQCGGGYNGGAGGASTGYGGGGASDIRLNGQDLADRIIVAGGGGGADDTYSSESYHGGNDGSGGAGGGLSGENAYVDGAYRANTAGTQTSGCQLGNGCPTTNNTDTGGGGGGYYGGLPTNHNNGGAGGGSGYVSELLTNAETIIGTSEMPTRDGKSTMIGNVGHGYAKITLLNQDNYLKELTSSVGTFDKEFNSTVENYTLTLDPYDYYVTLNGVSSNNLATVSGNGKFHIDEGTEIKNITVTSEDGSERVYTITIVRPAIDLTNHTQLLKSLSVTGYEESFEPEFTPNTDVYDLNISARSFDLTVKYEKFDNDTEVVVSGNKYLENDTGNIYVTVKHQGMDDKVYTIRYTKTHDEVENFSSTRTYKEFIAPVNGYYFIEAWGAQGNDPGNSSSHGGKGAYTSGYIYLEKNEKLYVYAGEHRTDRTQSFNAGSIGGSSSNNGYGGGGASDIRLVSGNWNDTISLRSRIMVAAGGAGSTNYGWFLDGGYGGALTGGDGNNGYTEYVGQPNTPPKGATQTSGGASHVTTQSSYSQGGASGTIGLFGIAGNSSTDWGSGGGGGYFGGSGGGWTNSSISSGSGGSSYISGYTGSVAVVSSQSSNPRSDLTGASCQSGTKDNLCSIHYSEKVFVNPVMKAGNELMPTQDGLAYQLGNSGNGFVKINLPTNDDYLKSLTSDKGTFNKEFDALDYNYNLTLGLYDEEFTLDGVTHSPSTQIEGLGKYKISNGEVKVITLKLTSGVGTEKNYTITVSRPNMNQETTRLKDLSVDNFTLSPKFDSNIFDYEITITDNRTNVNVNTVKYVESENIVIEGATLLLNDTGIIKVTVSNGDSEDTVYNITYKKVLAKEVFGYKTNYQVFKAKETGNYKIELWGAQGNHPNRNRSVGGKGAYTSGVIHLNKDEQLYIYVGEHRSDRTASMNAGSTGGSSSDTTNSGSSNGYGGGGATDVRLVSGAWNDSTSLNSRIMVAAGGAGASDYAYPANGGYGGALTGGNGINGKYPNAGYVNYPPLGATQTEAGRTTVCQQGVECYYGSLGSFGIAGSARTDWGSGGGGGYFGGTGAGFSSNSVDSGSGGSSYISGYTGSVAVLSSTDSNPRSGTNGNVCKSGTTDNLCSVHYSGKVFTNTIMKAGNEEMPTKDNNGVQIGNSGYGHAVITLVTDNNYLKSLVSDKGTFNKEFKPEELEYTLTLSALDNYVTLSALAYDDLATVSEIPQISVENGKTVDVNITVTSSQGNILTYVVHVKRENLALEHTTLLKNVSVDNYSLEPSYLPEINTYTLHIYKQDQELTINYDKYDEDNIVVVENNNHLTDQGNILITVTDPNTNLSNTYTINYIKDKKEEYGYTYNGSYHTFTALKEGFYKLEAWGAAGGDYDSSLLGGKGAYTSGIVHLDLGDVIYVYVGSQPSSSSTNLQGGYNGGGNCPSGKDKDGRAGGGATDFRLTNGPWNNLESLASRIMVAGAGGGAAYESSDTWRSNGGNAGGLSGNIPTSMGASAQGRYGTVGTQLNGGYAIYDSNQGRAGFGYGGNGYSTDGGSGGGAGYYGGGGSHVCSGGGGGSSFISGYLGSIAIKGENDISPRLDSSNEICTTESAKEDITCSYHYSGKVFTESQMISGNNFMPSHDGLTNIVGNSGNGYAKITYVPKSSDNYLKELTTNNGVFNYPLEDNRFNYTLTLDSNTPSFILNAIPYDINATVSYDKEYSINLGETKIILINVKAEDGSERVYTITATREDIVGNSTLLADLKIDKYPEINKIFKSNVFNYNINISPRTYDLTIIPTLVDNEATYKIEGNKNLQDITGTIRIIVSHNLVEDSIYTINYTKGSRLENEYEYTNDYQTFVAPYSGKYYVEAWGASGGYGATSTQTYPGGLGAYTSGYIDLKEGEKLYLYVGSQGENHSYISGVYANGGYNGGGRGGDDPSTSSSSKSGGAGGGASDVRLIKGDATDPLSLASRIMVAAAGAGGAYNDGTIGSGVSGGGLSVKGLTIKNGSYSYTVLDGTQTSGYKFGIGQDGSLTTNSYLAGSGGGYYTGYYNDRTLDIGPLEGIGGTSYISGHTGSVSIKASTSLTPKVNQNGQLCQNGTNDNYCSIHYSGKYFTDTKMIDGNGYNWTNVKGDATRQPTKDNLGTQTGNSGDGFIKITPITTNEDVYLKDIIVSDGTLNEAFNPLVEDYELEINPYNHYVDIEGILYDETERVSGNNRYYFEEGETKQVELIVTAENGDIKTYRINVTRPYVLDEHSSKLKTLTLEDYNDYINPEFLSTITDYELEISEYEVDVNLSYTTYDQDATVVVSKHNHLTLDSGTITLTVSAPNCTDTIYTLNYRKVPKSVVKYNYTGDYQIFTAPYTMTYRIEAYGAAGGSGGYTSGTGVWPGGAGGYTAADIHLNKGTKLYIYAGGKGTDHSSGNYRVAGGYNGGAEGDYDRTNYDTFGGGGGGATDIRLTPGVWNNQASLYSRIIVAGGGGGQSATRSGSEALSGIKGGNVDKSKDVLYRYTDSSQRAWRSSNILGSGMSSGMNYQGQEAAGGGGGGYYGGDSFPDTCSTNGGGGTSYATGCEGCDETYLDYQKLYGSQVELSNIEFKQGVNTGNGYVNITYRSDYLDSSDNNYLLSLTSDHGTMTQTMDPTNTSFDPLVQEYDLTLEKYSLDYEFFATLSDQDATIVGVNNIYTINDGERIDREVTVTAPNGDIRIYTIHVYRKPILDIDHTTLLKFLDVNGYEHEITPRFDPYVMEYDINILQSEIDLFPVYEVFDDETEVNITNNLYINEDEGTVEVTASHQGLEDSVYLIHYHKVPSLDNGIGYGYTGNYQTFTAPATDRYRFEVWGAAGGNDGQAGGRGGYSYGDFNLEEGQTVYIYVGNIGGTGSCGGGAGWNGGGNAGTTCSSGAGGGATDIRTIVGDLYSRMIVAGAGGGGGLNSAGGAGGGTSGIRANGRGPAGSQDSGYAFGQGQSYGGGDGGGGGAGWYGGYAANGDHGAAGGSGFVYSKDTQIYVPTGYKLDSKWYAFEGATYNGNQTVPTFDKKSTMTGNSSSGYARITRLHVSRDNYLLNITATDVEDKTIVYNLEPSFDKFNYEYNITIPKDDWNIDIEARASSDDVVSIDGLGDHLVPSGTTQFSITVTAASGDIRVYTVNVTREASDISDAKDITITGIVPSLCLRDETIYCNLEPKQFSSNVYEYTMTVPAGQKELEFTVDKLHYYETIIGDGVVKLNGGTNNFIIEVKSESGEVISTYRYEIIRDLTGDNYLDTLDVIEPDIDIGFNHLLTEYNFKVENVVDSLTLDIKTDDPNANYYINVDSPLEIDNEVENKINNLQVGTNYIDIIVTAANGEVRTYTLSVYRVASGDTLLKSLTVKDNTNNEYTLSPEFNPIKTEYTLTVPNTITELTTTGVANSSTTRVVGNGKYSLNTGLNEILLTTTAENGTIEIYKVIVTREKSDNNYIKSLTVPQGVISPVFNKETFEYTMTLEAHIKRITPNIILESDAATYEIENNSNFKVGENIVTIKVTAENGDVRNYTIIVTKEGSDDNYLADLDITDQDLPFAKDILEYNVTYPNQTTRVEVTGVLNDTLSKVEGFGSYTLVSGNNDITVKVTSETGIDRNYIIHAFREYATDATLKDLITSKGQLSPEFDKDIKAYSFTVPYENDSIILDVIPNSDVAKVKLSSNEATIKDNPLTNNENDYVVNLQVDENIITILVTAEDNITEEIYTVTVNREKSGNTNLASLIIKEAALSPTFNKAKLNYTAKVPYQISDVNVLAIPEDSNSSVIIEGNTNLEVGENIITVTVTAPSGKVSVYSVTLTRKPYSTTILTLDSLETSVCDIDFDKDTLYYECTVEYPINKTDITATTENNDATILGTGTNLDLNVGINVFPVRVVVGNEELDYQVVINREKSDEYRLSNLDVTNGTMDKEFNQDDLEYNVTITDINPIIVFEKLDPNQTVEIINNDLEFITGETRDVLVKVTSPSLRKDRTYTLHVTKEISSNAYLKNLSVLGLNLSEAFDKERDTYHLTVNDSYTSIYIQATPEYKYATVFGIGTNLLKVGENIIPITVTAEDGVTKKIYNLVVTRIGSTDATLRGLRVNDYEISPEFNPNTTTYTVNVPYNVSTVTIEANPNNDEATIVGDGVQAVRRGKNTLTVTVTSGNGTIKNYTIIVNRDNPVTSLLDNIVVDNYSLDPEFKSKIYEYNVVIDNEVTELGLHVIPIDSKATWEIMGNENFKVGLNEVTILVTSSDGEEQTTYKLMVNRQPYTNTYLSGITVNSDLTFYDLMPEFDKDILSYTVYVPNEISTVTLQATAQNVSNTITGLGNKNLSVGENIFNIKVSTKGGISRTYTVNIIRNGSNNAFIKSLTSNIGKVTRTGDYTFELTVPKGTTAVSHDNFVATPIDPLATVSYQDFVDLSKANDLSIVITSKDQTVSKEYVVYIRYEKDSETRLKNIETNNNGLNERFDRNTYTYTVDVRDDLNKITLIPTKINSKQTITNLTELTDYPLTEYTTDIPIRVKAEDDSTSTYHVIVSKTIAVGRKLKNISVTYDTSDCNTERCYTPEFNEDVYDYTVNVAAEVTDVNFGYIKYNPTMIVNIYDNDGNKLNVNNGQGEVLTYPVSIGDNKFKVELINGLNEKTYYNYNIVRELSDNKYLQQLNISEPSNYPFQETFDKETLEYTVLVPYEVSSVNVNAVAERPKVTRIRISGTTNLQVGNNDVKVLVTAQDNSTKLYVVHVIRTPEIDNYLKTLTVSSGIIYKLTPKFSPVIQSYTLDVPSVISSLNIDALANHIDATVSGVGELDLEVGRNVINIDVTNQNKTRTYQLIITRAANKNPYIANLRVNNGTLDDVDGWKKDRLDHYITVPYNQSSVDLDITMEDPYAHYVIIGNRDFTVGNNIVEIKTTSSDLSVSMTYKLNVTKIGSDNNYLKDITIDGESIEDFRKDKFIYDITIPYGKDPITLLAELDDPNATVAGEGIISNDEGDNQVSLIVTSESGTTQAYILNIHRNRSPYLKDITTTLGELLSFNKLQNEYILEVDYDTRNISISSTPEDPKAIVSGNNTYSLNPGDNNIYLTVVSQDNEKNIYTLKVVREPSDNNYLESLTLLEGTFDVAFDKEILEYNIDVSNDLNALNITAIAEDKEASVEIIDNNLKINNGRNDVIVRVTSTSNKVRDYIIHVNKHDDAYFSNRLKDLVVSEGNMSPAFDSNINNYTVTVAQDVSSVVITPTVESESSTIDGDFGEQQLVIGRNEFHINVTSLEGNKNTYTVVVYRNEKPDARLEMLAFTPDTGTLTPNFNKNRYSYTLTISTDSNIIVFKTIQPVESTANCTVINNGVKTLCSETKSIVVGNNQSSFDIKLISSDNSQTKNYHLVIKRGKSSNNLLANLETNIGTLTPSFDPYTNRYTVNVNKDINSIRLSGSTQSSKASVSGLGTVILDKGSNIANVTVTAENGTINTYTIVVNRDLDTNNYLKSLVVKDNTLNEQFDKLTTTYSLSVPYETEDIVVLAEAESNVATVNGNGTYYLEEGENVIDLTVTAENGDKNTYVLNVTREPIDSYYIKDLYIEEGELTPIFIPRSNVYSVTIPNEYNYITPHITLESKGATYTIRNNQGLQQGTNKVYIDVTSPKGNTYTYTINVNRSPYTNNYLKSLNVSIGTMIPVYDKEVVYYEVNLANNIEEITLSGEAELATTTIEGLKTYQLNPGENHLYVKATSDSRITRTYHVNVKRAYNTNNYLSSLSVDKGTLSPTFTKTNNNYQVTVPNNVDKINVVAIPEVNVTTVLGSGEHNLNIGNNIITVKAISEANVTNIYTINVNRLASNNLNIVNITPSIGEITPNNDFTGDKYTINVPTNTNALDINITLEDSKTTISNNKAIMLASDKETKTVVLTAADNTVRNLVFTIIKESSNVTSIDPNKNAVDIVVGDTYQIESVVKPENAINKELTYTSSDQSIATVDSNGLIKGIKDGIATITVRSVSNPSISSDIEVGVISNKLQSSILDIYRSENDPSVLEDYVIGAEPQTTYSDFKDMFINNPEYIKIYDMDNNLITDVDNLIGTFMKVTLEINDKAYDSLTVVVRGDLNGDCYITVVDNAYIENMILYKVLPTFITNKAADLNNDEYVTVVDNATIENYILGKTSKLNDKN